MNCSVSGNFKLSKKQVILMRIYLTGAFLVPYVFFVVMLAIPMVILESSFGQRVGRGVMQSWSAIPIMKGKIAFV